MIKKSGFKMKNPSMAKLAKQAGAGSPMKLDLGELKKKAKKFANESTFLNPRSSDEVIKDRADSQTYTASMKQDRKEGKKSKTTQLYEDKLKKKRPNKKNRY
jgi:hypothetical protein